MSSSTRRSRPTSRPLETSRIRSSTARTTKMSTETKSIATKERAVSRTSVLATSITAAEPSSSPPSPVSLSSRSASLTTSTSIPILRPTDNAGLHPSIVLPSAPPTPSESVIHQLDNARPSQSGLKPHQIVGIAATAGVIFLALVAALSYYLINRRRERRSPPSKGPHLDNHIVEKLGGDAQYTAYSGLGYRQVSAESRGTAPLIGAHAGRSPISSTSEMEEQHIGYVPPSPFLDGSSDTALAPISHAVSLANATPFAEPEVSPVDHTTLAPTRSQSSTRSRAPIALAPIAIPEYVPPPRRNTKGRRSARYSKRSYRALDTGEASGDDSSSMYSQASAPPAAVHSYTSTSMELSDSTIRAYPMSAIPLLGPSVRRAVSPEPEETVVMKPMTPHSPFFSPTAADDEATAQLARGNTLFVAKLLKSRVKNFKEPERSSSVVSHIERAGSIRPAFLPLDQEDSSNSRRRLRLDTARAARKNRALAPMPLVSSPQDVNAPAMAL